MHERTLRFKKEYPKLHFEEGVSPLKAAKIFRISSATAYRAIAEIAKERNISYDSLLQKPGMGNFGHGGKDLAPLAPINVSAIKVKLQELCEGHEVLKRDMTKLVEGLEKDLEEMLKQD